jgi:hypothetical protein
MLWKVDDVVVRIAPEPALALYAKIIAGVCTRIPVLSERPA